MKDNITIYGTPVCSQCKNVTKYLNQNGINYDYKSVGEDVSKEELEQIVQRNVRAVPVITMNGTETTFDKLKKYFSEPQSFLSPSMIPALEL